MMFQRKPASWVASENEIHLITAAGVEDWPSLDKQEVARRLATRIAEALR